MPLKLNFSVALAIIFVALFLFYIYNQGALQNEGEVDPEKIRNDVLNDEEMVGLDQYANYEGKQLPRKETENIVEYKGKKFRVGEGTSYNVQDYLPQELNSGWFTDPATTVSISDTSLIDNRDFIGINTVGQSLRNASLDLRAAPPCPRVNVSIWNQSTIEPDTNIKSLC